MSEKAYYRNERKKLIPVPVLGARQTVSTDTYPTYILITQQGSNHPSPRKKSWLRPCLLLLYRTGGYCTAVVNYVRYAAVYG